MNQVTQLHTHASRDYSHSIDTSAIVLQQSDTLFSMGDQLEGIYRVNSGSIKLVKISRDGDQQILGFYLPGDLIGLDALADGVSRSTAQVLETSNVSLIPFKSVFHGGGKFDQRSFIQYIGESFNQESDHTMMLAQSTAKRRLAWFLIGYSDGLVKRGLRARVFRLPMIRSDIALFLGLAVETVSRELSRMSKQGLLNRNQRQFELTDIDRLRQLADGEDTFDKDFTRSNQTRSLVNTNKAYSLAIH